MIRKRWQKKTKEGKTNTFVNLKYRERDLLSSSSRCQRNHTKMIEWMVQWNVYKKNVLLMMLSWSIQVVLKTLVETSTRHMNSVLILDSNSLYTLYICNVYVCVCVCVNKKQSHATAFLYFYLKCLYKNWSNATQSRNNFSLNAKFYVSLVSSTM